MVEKDHERICVERFLAGIGSVPTLIEDSERLISGCTSASKWSASR